MGPNSIYYIPLGFHFFLSSHPVMSSVIHKELAAMKQVLISMLAKQGDTSLGVDKTGAGSAGAGQAQVKRVGRSVEEESPKQPKPTVFVSV